MTPPKRTFKNYNVPKPVRLPKGRLIKIDFGEHEQEVKRIWEGKPLLLWFRDGKKKDLEAIKKNITMVALYIPE
ncbi:MAG: hypothetical protein WAM19_06630 [Nitrososphaeraceae archaeon]